MMRNTVPPPSPLDKSANARAAWSRRRLLEAGAAGMAGLAASALVFPYLVGGRWRMMSPRAAQAAQAALRAFREGEAQLLAQAAEVLVPGAKEAGIVPYLDAQLAADPAEALLILRYLDVAPPYLSFYRKGLTALTQAAAAMVAGAKGAAATAAATAANTGREDRPVTAGALTRVMTAVMNGQTVSWPSDAPPAAFFLFVLRADAIDVTYGTPEGFQRLGIDYIPHIAPARPW